MDDDNDVVLQPRCVHCLLENYVLNLIAYSAGESVCHNCGWLSWPMTRSEYRDAMAASRERQDAIRDARTRIPRQPPPAD